MNHLYARLCLGAALWFLAVGEAAAKEKLWWTKEYSGSNSYRATSRFERIRITGGGGLQVFDQDGRQIWQRDGALCMVSADDMHRLYIAEKTGPGLLLDGWTGKLIKNTKKKECGHLSPNLRYMFITEKQYDPEEEIAPGLVSQDAHVIDMETGKTLWHNKRDAAYEGKMPYDGRFIANAGGIFSITGEVLWVFPYPEAYEIQWISPSLKSELVERYPDKVLGKTGWEKRVHAVSRDGRYMLLTDFESNGDGNRNLLYISDGDAAKPWKEVELPMFVDDMYSAFSEDSRYFATANTPPKPPSKIGYFRTDGTLKWSVELSTFPVLMRTYGGIMKEGQSTAHKVRFIGHTLLVDYDAHTEVYSPDGKMLKRISHRHESSYEDIIGNPGSNYSIKLYGVWLLDDKRYVNVDVKKLPGGGEVLEVWLGSLDEPD